jgi:hypothetical protein
VAASPSPHARSRVTLLATSGERRHRGAPEVVEKAIHRRAQFVEKRHNRAAATGNA